MYYRYFSICMLTYILKCIYVVSFLLEERKRAICITENDQFTSSCTWNYQGSYSNQHDYIIKKKEFKKSAAVSDLKSKN